MNKQKKNKKSFHLLLIFFLSSIKLIYTIKINDIIALCNKINEKIESNFENENSILIKNHCSVKYKFFITVKINEKLNKSKIIHEIKNKHYLIYISILNKISIKN